MKIPQGKFANFHVVTGGSCWFRVGSASPTRMSPGDVLIFPRGSAHVLGDQPDSEPKPATEILNNPRETDAEDENLPAFGGAGGPASSLICGHFEYDRELPHPLFETLDECLYVPARQASNTAWIQEASELAARMSDSGAPGSEAVVDRLAEALFVSALSEHVTRMPNSETFLAALRDQHIGETLRSIHRDIARDWDLNEMASIACMSRSLFAERFKTLVGVSPMVYLARWRMLKARELLANTSRSVSTISAAVGYQSEFSFSRAFKKLCGQSPSAFRREFSRQ